MMISKGFKFDAAHKLPDYEGKCKNLQGHTWKLVVCVEGEVDSGSGMIIDFCELKRLIKEQVLDRLDHSYLNDLIENPTCENVLLWIKGNLKISGLKCAT